MGFNTNLPNFIRHKYKVSNEVQSYTVYSLVEVAGIRSLLPEILRIEKYNNRSNATNIEYYLRLRTASSWEKSEKVTGLRPTAQKGVFYGDRLNKVTGKKSLLLFTYSNDGKTLFIDVFLDFYPNHKGTLHNIIKRLLITNR